MHDPFGLRSFAPTDLVDRPGVKFRHAAGRLASWVARDLPAVRYAPPEAGYLAWLDCRALGLGEDPAAAFLERGRVALTSGLTFGTGGAGHARLNVGTSGALLEEAVRRMATAVASAAA